MCVPSGNGRHPASIATHNPDAARLLKWEPDIEKHIPTARQTTSGRLTMARFQNLVIFPRPCQGQAGPSRNLVCELRSHRLAVVLALASVCAAPRGAAQDAPEHRPNVIVVQFAPEISVANKSGSTGLQTFDRLAATFGVHTIERVYPFLDHVEPTPKTRRNLMALRRTYYVQYDAEAAPKHVARQFEGIPGVVYAEPVIVNRPQVSSTSSLVEPDDPRFWEQSELRQLRLPEAWDMVKSENRSPRVVIAIVDVGGEWRHEDLVGNVWTNPDEIPGNGVDDDNNGFIDDVHGVNLANDDETDNDPTPSVDDFHGTASAGSAGAVTDNGVGIAGPAWNAEIMHVNSKGLFHGYEGILYAAANGADIINASWAGHGYSDVIYRLRDETLDLATDMGSLVVASAANAGRNNDLNLVYPARHPRVLSVGATERESRVKAGFSHYGKLVNVFAPGVSILTTSTDNRYRLWGGTSASSPLAAGVAALVKTRFPDMTPDAVREQVRLTSENMDAENPGLAGQLGRGFVNALAAVQEPALPAVRLKRWRWTDEDGDLRIDSGDRVTITGTVVNYLVDARQLTVGLVGAEPYPFLDMTRAESLVGSLASDDSAVVRFEFAVAPDAPANQWIRFYTRMREGAHTDEADMISLRINYELESVYESLSALYRATGGDSWNHNRGWNITTVPTEHQLITWFGVWLVRGFLVELTLHRNNLTGEIPAELGSLSQLRTLRLEDNSLKGVVPSELGNLAQLHRLYLQNNILNGPIPSELGNLTQLHRLYLQNNTLTGPIPSELGNLAQLQWLWLYNNTLTGPIPTDLGNLAQLQFLALQSNTLAGPIPTDLGNLAQLQQLDLSRNTLTGPIPTELGNLAELRWLHLRNNTLTGPIPTELGNLSQLKQLSLGNNALTGMLPRTLMQLDGLEVFHFGGQDLCAPGDDAFQAWLSSIPDVDGPTCAALQFTDGMADHTFTVGAAIPALVLPEASGGIPSYTYTLQPGLPAGLVFDDSTRTISGVPAEVAAAASYTYSAADQGGSSVRLTFTLAVAAAVSIEDVVADQSYPRAHPIAPLFMPEAAGGVPPIGYLLTPTLPAGLSFDASTRTISGTPTEVTAEPVPYTYKATDTNGSADSLQFTIQVYSPVAAEHEALPESFAVHGNYPNPFRESTRLVFDLPWPARVTVEVMDITGRRAITVPAVSLAAGWEHAIEFSGARLSSGLYLYRLSAVSPEGSSVHVGRFVRVR